MLDRQLELHAVDDFQRVFNFVAHEKRQNLDLKVELCDILLRHLQR